MKKIISLILVLVLLLSFSAVNIVSAKVANDEQLYIDLGILPEKKTQGLIKPSLNREQLAGILVRMQGLTWLTEVVDLAGDIEKSKLKNEINYCLSYGYFTVDEEGNFNPGDDITYQDGVRALMTVLGYDTLIEDKTKTEDFMALAGRIGLLKGVTVENPEKLSYDELYELVTNAMRIKMPQHEILVEGYTKTLHDRLGVTERIGKLLANSTYSAGVDKTSKNHVNIGGTIYACDVEVPNELVGVYVTYFTREDVVVSVTPSVPLNSVSLRPSDIFSVKDSGNAIVLECAGEQEFKIPKSAVAIVNNKLSAPTKALFDAYKSGELVLIDSEDSGTYDVIHLNIAKTVTAGAVSLSSYTISAEYSGETVILESAKSYLEVYRGSKPIEFSEISVGDVVSVICDSFTLSGGDIALDYTKAKYVKLYVSDTVVSGTVDQVDGDGYVYIDDMDYETADSFDKLVASGKMENVRVGDYIHAKLDVWGYVADYEVDKAKSGYDYGYLIAQDLDAKSFSRAQQFKIMNSEGEIAVYDASEKLIVDGVSFTDKAATYNVGTGQTVDFGKRQPIAFRLAADGKVKHIDTAVRSAGETDSSLTPALAFDPYATGLTKSTMRSSIVNRKVAIGSDCVVFVDSAGLGMNNPSDHYFSVMPVSATASARTEYIALYDADSMGSSKCAVIYQGYDANGPSSSASATKDSQDWNKTSYMVEKVIKAVDAAGNSMFKVTLANYSGKTTFSTVGTDSLQFYSMVSINESWVYEGDGGGRTTSETIPLVHQDAERLADILKPGDIVRYDTDGSGKLSYIERIMIFEEVRDQIVPLTGTGGTTMLYAYLEKTSDDLYRYSMENPGTNPDCEKNIFSTRARSAVVLDVKRGKLEIISDHTKTPSFSTGDDVRVWYRDYNNGQAVEYFVYLY